MGMWRLLVLVPALVPALVAMLLGSAGPGLAGDQARVLASRFYELPAGLPVSVDVYDDSALNLELRDTFVAALKARGVLVEPRAPLEVMLDLRVQEGKLERTEPSLGQARTDLGDSEIDVNVLSNREDSLLGGQRSEPGTRVIREGVVALVARLRDPEARELLWQGEAATAMDARGLEGLAPLLVAPLAASYGESADRSVTLRP